MHLRYAALLVASSVAVTTFAESAKNVSMTPPPLAPSSTTFDLNVSQTNDPDALASPDSTDEERAFEYLKAIPVYKALHSDVAISLNNMKSTLDRKKWFIQGRDPIKQYHILKLQDVPDELLLENLHWKNWAVFVCQQNNYSDPAKVIVFFMQKIMDDKRLLTMLLKGIDHSPTTSLAGSLMAAKKQLWLHEGSEPDKVFTSLGLDQDAQSLFNNALYPHWFEFVQAFQMKHLDSKLTEVGCLKKIFKTDTDLLTVLTSANNMRSQKGQEALKQLFEERIDSAKFFDALMHSRSGLRVYFSKYKLHNDAQQEEIMTMTSLRSTIDPKSMEKLREFMISFDISYPKPEDVLRVVLEVDDPILTVWVDYMKLYTVRLPVADPVIKTFEVLAEKDNAAKVSQSIVRLFIHDWVQNSVEPSKVYKMLLSDKDQDAKELQNIWKTFIDEYRKKNEVNLPEKGEITHDGMDEVKTLKEPEFAIPDIKSYIGNDAKELQDAWKAHMNDYWQKKMARLPEKSEFEIPEKIGTFMELSAKLDEREPDDDITMRMIVLDWMKNQPQPEKVLKTLLLDAGATRLLDHWVDFMGEYLEKMTIANLNELISLPDKDPTYVNMLSMLSALRDLGHLPSRMIMSRHELKWLDLNLSPTNVFTILKLDKAINEMLEEDKTLLLAKNEAAQKLAETADTPVSPLASPFRPIQGTIKPSVEIGPPLLGEDVSTSVDTALSELFTNPLLAVFLDFRKHYSGRHKTNETLLKTLLAIYGEKVVAKLLNDAKKLSQPIQDLQNELFKHYVETGKRPDDIMILLGLTRDKVTGARLWKAYDQVYSDLS